MGYFRKRKPQICAHAHIFDYSIQLLSILNIFIHPMTSKTLRHHLDCIRIVLENH